jgi:pimeloyl-ACP methyl ester carboxylesterase
VLATLLGGRAYAEKFGDGEPQVVALHGWARNRSDWAGTLDGTDALALDLPGFGATPTPPAGWSTLEYAGWLAQILDDVDRPVLVGHSFGGRIAIQLAATRPELVRGLVLTGVPFFRSRSHSRPPLGFRMARSAHANGLIDDETMEKYRHKYGSPDYRATSGHMRDVLVKAVNEEYAVQLDTIARSGLPVRLVWGEADEISPLWMAQRAAQILDAPFVVVPNSGHQIDARISASLRSAIESLP